MNYWAIIDNQKIGPLTLQELQRLPLQRDTLVWHSGLPTWRQAGFIPELADALAGEESAASVNPYIPPVPPTPTLAAPSAANHVPDERQHEPQPPTYLAWSIVAIVLCCMIPGVVAVIYSSKVSSRYASGDYEGARKASQNAELWIIIAVTLGIISLPFQIVLALI